MSHILNIKQAGADLENAKKALIMIHGRGATAESILSLSNQLNVEGYALLAPQATNNTWYPHSFMASVQVNEPWLSSALNIVKQTVDKVIESGIAAKDIFFLGFSQGACLVAEYTTRNAQKYGGVVIFTGGLIGYNIKRDNYSGDFGQTPVFFGTGNPDFHVPLERVYASSEIAREMNANVIEKVYENRGHTISEDEIKTVNKLIFK